MITPQNDHQIRQSCLNALARQFAMRIPPSTVDQLVGARVALNDAKARFQVAVESAVDTLSI